MTTTNTLVFVIIKYLTTINGTKTNVGASIMYSINGNAKSNFS